MKLPDGPKTHPVLQLIQWLIDPLDYMETAAAQFGGMFTARWGGLKTAVIVTKQSGLAALTVWKTRCIKSANCIQYICTMRKSYDFVNAKAHCL